MLLIQAHRQWPLDDVVGEAVPTVDAPAVDSGSYVNGH